MTEDQLRALIIAILTASHRVVRSYAPMDPGTSLESQITTEADAIIRRAKEGTTY